MFTQQRLYPLNYDQVRGFVSQLEDDLAAAKGRRGNGRVRLLIAQLKRRYPVAYHEGHIAASMWRQDRMARKGTGLAKRAGLHWDEHAGYGASRGDYRHTTVLDYIPPAEAVRVPYCDSGRAGLALIEVTRTRVYAKRSQWYPSATSTRFLVGRNESGTFFAHPVPRNTSSVAKAEQWIWGGLAEHIVRRQGDVAVVASRGPRMPTRLPSGHAVEGDYLVHATHPPMRLPGQGERIIVGRRADAKAAQAVRD